METPAITHHSVVLTDISLYAIHSMFYTYWKEVGIKGNSVLHDINFLGNIMPLYLS